MSLKNLLFANILLLCNASGMEFNQVTFEGYEQELANIQAGLSQITVSPNQKNNGDTTLHMAARQNNVNAVITLLEQGANPWARNRNGEVPIQVTTNSDIQTRLGYYMLANDDIEEENN